MDVIKCRQVPDLDYRYVTFFMNKNCHLYTSLHIFSAFEYCSTDLETGFPFFKCSLI
jgi:hypothetical protein